MKKKYKILLFTSILFLFFSNSIYLSASESTKALPQISNADACMNYYNKVSTSPNPRANSMYAYYAYKDYGIVLKHGVLDKTDIKRSYIRNEDGYLLVGNINTKAAAAKINIGDAIISIDGIDFKDKDSNSFYDFPTNKKLGDISSFVLRKKDGKDYKVELEIAYSTITRADYKLRDLFINDINIKKNTYTISIYHTFRYWWEFKNNNTRDENHILYDLALGNLIFEEFPGHWYAYNCYPDEDDFKYSTLLNPSTYQVENLSRADKSLEEKKHSIFPYSKLEGIDGDRNAIAVEVDKKNVLEVRNQFNLRSFPFDKQKLVFELSDMSYGNHVRNIRSTLSTFVYLEDFMKIDDIPGWNKINYDINYPVLNKPTMQEGTYAQGIKVELEIERKFGYYIFKVIFPIILILLICWSSVWINPKELESRLTITIVCLLSLIAYNFVIDSELPKLEYLTVLDWIILISYVYATIPNILSVYSFRISSTNKILCEKVEGIAREYGLLSYIILIILIVILNANLNPTNSGSLISWMTIFR